MLWRRDEEHASALGRSIQREATPSSRAQKNVVAPILEV